MQYNNAIFVYMYYRIKQSATSGSKKKKGALKNSKNKGAKKPKAGKGKRDLHKKIGGRKRR